MLKCIGLFFLCWIIVIDWDILRFLVIIICIVYEKVCEKYGK